MEDTNEQNVEEQGKILYLPVNKKMSCTFADLESKIYDLENEKKKLRDEFDLQRAKMKDLFLQKEGLKVFVHTFNILNCMFSR